MNTSTESDNFLKYLPENGRWPHAVLLESGGEAERALRFSRMAAAALICEMGKPDCGCGVCRRILEGIHPDVSLLDREGRDITVDDIRALRRDAFVAPLESHVKVYIIAGAEKMNIAASNAALKILEEPPAGVYFILISESARSLLQTVRSRLTVLRLVSGSEVEASDEESIALAGEFISAFAKNDELLLLEFCMKNEKLKRAQLGAFFGAVLEILREALRVCAGAQNTENPDILEIAKFPMNKLIRITEIIYRRRELNNANVGAAHLMGTIPAEYFAAE